MSVRDNFEKRVGEQFREATKDHVMTVLREDGLYRHVRFAKPGTGFYHFDLITWPGYLAISGDMDGHIFRRLEDMFQFFAGDRQINPVYWSEKLCTDRGRRGVKEYDEEIFHETVADHIKDYEDEFPGLAAAVQEQVFDEDYGDEDYARQLLQDFKHEGFEFTDVWEWDFTYYSHHFLWCCYAIQWGVKTYREAESAAPKAVADAA